MLSGSRNPELGARGTPRRLTLIARGVVLLLAEVLANVVLWVVSIIVFSVLQHRSSNRSRGATASKAEGVLSGDSDAPVSHPTSLLSLALLAWTIGLRHALDADHISAIDNATRRIMAVRNKRGVLQRPVTVGLFFSLGHSTIVVAVLIAIAVSFTVYERMDKVSDIGGVIGASVSGSLLFLLGVVNTVLLVRAYHRYRHRHLRHNHERAHFRGLITRIAEPLLRAVDRPWKMYPVGILFGLGFDTASTIALLGIAVVASTAVSDSASGNGSVVLLALLFTVGMTLVDSCDAVLMVCAYAWEEVRRSWGIWERPDCERSLAVPWDPESNEKPTEADDPEKGEADVENKAQVGTEDLEEAERTPQDGAPETGKDSPREESESRDAIGGQIASTATPFAMFLTLLSIIIAFVVSIIEIMGLISERCTQCSDAAERQEKSHSGGLAGRWWLFWQRCNDNFEYIGAGIAGGFLVCVLAAVAVALLHARRREKRARACAQTDQPGADQATVPSWNPVDVMPIQDPEPPEAHAPEEPSITTEAPPSLGAVGETDVARSAAAEISVPSEELGDTPVANLHSPVDAAHHYDRPGGVP